MNKNTISILRAVAAAQRVITAARSIVAIDFPNMKEYREYMHDHPGADPRHHRVVDTVKKPSHEEVKPTSPDRSDNLSTPDAVRSKYGQDAVIKNFHLPSGGVAFSYKSSDKDGEYHLVVGGKEVAKGNSVLAYDEKRWKAEDKDGVHHLFHNGEEVASGQDVDSWSPNMWSATDMQGKTRLFQGGKQVDEVGADSGKLEGVSDGMWIKSDFKHNSSGLYINGVKVADGKDIRKMVSEKGVESDGIVQVDGHTVNAKNYQQFVKGPEFWDEFVKKNGNPFTGDHQPVQDAKPGLESAKSQSDALGLPEPEGEKVVQDRGESGVHNVKHNYKWSDTGLAESVVGGDNGVSDNAIKEMAGFKVGLADEKPEERSRSIAEIKQDFLRKMDPNNYEDHKEFEKSKKRIEDMSNQEFSLLLVLIVANEEDKEGEGECEESVDKLPGLKSGDSLHRRASKKTTRRR